MTTGVLLALTGDDAGIVRALDVPGTGLTVVRRCADLPELLSAGMAGLGTVAVVDTELDDVDRTVVDRLHRAGLSCLVLCEPGDERRWCSMGLAVLPRPAAPDQVRTAVQLLARGVPGPGPSPAGAVPAPGPGTSLSGPVSGARSRADDAAGLPAGPDTAGAAPAHGTTGGGPASGLLPGLGGAPGKPPAGGVLPPQAATTHGAAADGPGGGLIRPSRPAPPPPTLASPGDPDVAAGAPTAGPAVAVGAGDPGRPVPGDGPEDATPAAERGRIVVVWGPAGAPGRSTVAASLAQGLSAAGPVLLVDADLEAPCLVQLLGLPEDSSGLASAARLASHGRLDDDALDRLVAPVHDRLGLLSGLGRPGRWRELPPASMAEVWEVARHRGGWTVVDLAAGLETDQVDDFALEPGRHAVASALLEQADVVVVVGAGDPVGVRRLVQLLGDLDGLVTLTGRLEVVVNRVRASAAGPAPERAVREAVARFGGVEDLTVVPEDAVTVDRCLLEGRSVLEGAPRTAVGRALAGLADRVDVSAGALAAAERPGRLAVLGRGARQVLRRRRDPGASGPGRHEPGPGARVRDEDAGPADPAPGTTAGSPGPGETSADRRDGTGTGRDDGVGRPSSTAVAEDASAQPSRARRAGRHRR